MGTKEDIQKRPYWGFSKSSSMSFEADILSRDAAITLPYYVEVAA
ncbi:MAG: hypothetical protein AAFZ74_18900 [Pseudomonadota bacterium]